MAQATPAAKMPGAYAAKATDVSAAERFKFGTTASKTGAFSSTYEDFSAAERLKFGIVSSAAVAQATAPGIYSMSNEDTTAAERLKFGIAVPVVNNVQVSAFDPTSEYSQSYESSGLTNDYWGTQTNQNQNNNAAVAVEAEIVSDHDHDDDNSYSSSEFDDEESNSKLWRVLCIICSVVSLAIIIGLSTALSSKKNDALPPSSTGDNTTDRQQPTSYPSMSPSLPPVDISWCFNSEYVENFRYASLRSALIASGISTDAEFATDDSYQRKSLCWLAFGDGLQIDKSDPFIEQRFALATLFYSLNEPSKLLTSGWLSGKQECNWTPMVECDLRTGSTVSKLNISSFDLQGQLPKEMSFLQYVTHLDASKNLLDGGVANATSGWNQLQELRLANNRFETVPEIMNAMKSITYFDISENNIGSDIPVFLSFMSNLVYLDISSNSFKNTIPDYIGGNLPNLYSLYMHSNDLTGEMPESICNLRKLGLIHLSADCSAGRKVNCDVPQCCTACNGYTF